MSARLTMTSGDRQRLSCTPWCRYGTGWAPAQSTTRRSSNGLTGAALPLATSATQMSAPSDNVFMRRCLASLARHRHPTLSCMRHGGLHRGELRESLVPGAEFWVQGAPGDVGVAEIQIAEGAAGG